jgi:MFS family permease
MPKFAGPALTALAAGRFVTGLGVGAISVVVPLFNAELAPPGIRGTLVALQQLSICCK